ncbi:thiol reductant ABC exporter subunit CydC [Rubrobacter calidifluminis]|uniref:thiol reductant ABC exporter subunit CydC n=1 Tax=Rubrobacter calidifluminis TaxID=1392640 RepID=UPI0023627000|nr:thiol reductant ABC exporter subunit CydC [Rubrobacter calidifluminis]
MMLRLAGFLRPFGRRAALAVALGVATIASNVGLLALAAFLIAAAALKPELAALSVPIYLVRLFGVSRGFARYAERLVSHDVTFRLLSGLRTWFYSRLEPLVPAGLQGHRSGDLLDRLVKDVDELQNVYLRVFSPMLVAAATTLGTVALLWTFSPTLALAALAFLLAAGVGVPVLANALSSRLGREEVRLRGELEAVIVDGVQGVQDILAFGAEDEQGRRLAAVNGALSRVQRRMAFVGGLQGALGELLSNLAVLVLLVLAIPLVTSGAVRGVYLAFLALVILGAFEAINPLGEAFWLLGRSREAAERIFEVADEEPRVVDPAPPSPMPEDTSLEFRGVSFRYAQGEPQVLHDLSFELPPGGRVAIVGPSGAGKSTVAHLALRLWDPEAGEVRFGGQDVRELAQEDLRSRISLISQDTHLFNGTFRRNLLLAAPEATDEEIWQALAVARLDGLVRRLPDGLDSWVGEQGLRLSGGERQRLAVARALIRDAPVLVLDEPTANLDTVTEAEFLEALREAMEGRSVLMITHRLVGMERMDEILVLDSGRIVERGTHAELLRSGGLYGRMYALQSTMLSTGGGIR